MKILKPIIGTSFLAGLLGMLLSIVALESGRLDGATYWATISSSAVLSGGAILAARFAYDYEERRTSNVHARAKRHSGRAVPQRKQPEDMR
jgi:hypothetical protein